MCPNVYSLVHLDCREGTYTRIFPLAFHSWIIVGRMYQMIFPLLIMFWRKWMGKVSPHFSFTNPKLQRRPIAKNLTYSIKITNCGIKWVQQRIFHLKISVWRGRRYVAQKFSCPNPILVGREAPQKPVFCPLTPPPPPTRKAANAFRKAQRLDVLALIKKEEKDSFWKYSVQIFRGFLNNFDVFYSESQVCFSIFLFLPACNITLASVQPLLKPILICTQLLLFDRNELPWNECMKILHPPPNHAVKLG